MIRRAGRFGELPFLRAVNVITASEHWRLMVEKRLDWSLRILSTLHPVSSCIFVENFNDFKFDGWHESK